MNQIRRCIALIGLALALTGWSAESVAWHKGAYHSEPEPWEVQSEPSSAPQDETDQPTARSEGSVAPVEDLKELRAEFSGYAYVSPPRTISDVIELLGPKRPVKECDSADRSVIAFKPMSFRRGREILVYNYYTSVAHRAFVRGNVKKSVEYSESLARKFPDTHYGELAAVYYILAKYYGYLGNFGAAEHALREGGRNFNLACRWAGTYLTEKAYAAMIEYREEVAKSFIQQSLGNYFNGEIHLRNAIALSYGVGYWGQTTFKEFLVLLAELSQNLARQNRLAEAEIEIRKALSMHHYFTPTTAFILTIFSEILYEQGRFKDAETLVRRVINIYNYGCLPRTLISYAAARRMIARALLAQNRWAEALEEYEAIRDAMAPHDPETFERKFSTDADWGLALFRTGKVGAATEKLAAAYDRNRKRLGDSHYRTAQALGLLAIAHAAAGDRKRALKEFNRAIPLLLDDPGRSAEEGAFATARDRRLRLIVEGYISLLENVQGTALEGDAESDPVAESFRVAELARGRSVHRALAANSARAAANNPELADLARREQDAKLQLGALNGHLLNVLSEPPDEQMPGVVADLRERVSALERVHATLTKEIDRRFPRYAALINLKGATVEQVQANLRPGEALVATFVGEDRTFVWAVPYRGKAVFRGIDKQRAEVDFDVNWLRGALNPNIRTLGDIPAFDVGAAHALYRTLLEPVKQGWDGANNLLIVADGPLGQLPFSMLPTEAPRSGPDEELLFAHYRSVPWLARTHAVTALPSAASLVTLRSVPPRDTTRVPFIGFGDPWFSPEQAAAARSGGDQTMVLANRSDLSLRGLPIRLRSVPATDDVDSAELARLPRLPDTADEVRSIALALNADPTQDVFIGDAASETRVKTMDMSGRKVIVFATHGLLSGDLNGLTQPALALSSPAVVGGEDDGLLTMGEILGLKLNADWVVLSACNTASGDGAGAEAVSGLGRAFFYAGARALLVSNWPVHSQSAKDLTTELFRRQAAGALLTRAEALRKAMVAMIDGGTYADPATGEALFSYAHPIFWAPFTLVGDGG